MSSRSNSFWFDHPLLEDRDLDRIEIAEKASAHAYGKHKRDYEFYKKREELAKAKVQEIEKKEGNRRGGTYINAKNAVVVKSMRDNYGDLGCSGGRGPKTPVLAHRPTQDESREQTEAKIGVTQIEVRQNEPRQDKSQLDGSIGDFLHIGESVSGKPLFMQRQTDGALFLVVQNGNCHVLAPITLKPGAVLTCGKDGLDPQVVSTKEDAVAAVLPTAIKTRVRTGTNRAETIAGVPMEIIPLRANLYHMGLAGCVTKQLDIRVNKIVFHYGLPWHKKDTIGAKWHEIKENLIGLLPLSLVSNMDFVIHIRNLVIHEEDVWSFDEAGATEEEFTDTAVLVWKALDTFMRHNNVLQSDSARSMNAYRALSRGLSRGRRSF